MLASLAVAALSGRVSALTDAAGRSVSAFASLDLPPGYVAVSPLSRTLDALTLLSAQQTIATLIGALALTVLVLAARHGIRPISPRTWITWITSTAVVIACAETAAVFLPRPMARLRVEDPDLVVVDFHSHTGASHDVRKSFDAEDNRSWHRAGGFDIAWITDHVKFDSPVAARARNPSLAGGGTSLLTGVEGRYHKIMSTIMLGLDERDAALLNRRGNLLPGTPARGAGPVTIVSLPNRNLDSVTAQSLDSIPRFVAIELIDAAPRGLAQFDREESRVRALAGSLHLTLVAASNNHGFGHAVAAWNAMRVPGWWQLTPDSVGRVIESTLRSRDTSAVTIVMRTRPRVDGPAAAATLPILVYQILGSLTWPERAAWLVWIWLATLVVAVRRRKKEL